MVAHEGCEPFRRGERHVADGNAIERQEGMGVPVEKVIGAAAAVIGAARKTEPEAERTAAAVDPTAGSMSVITLSAAALSGGACSVGRGELVDAQAARW
jgi:hypothetical protein